MKRCKPMKTQLSLTNLLKTKEKDIFIFDRNEKGDVDFKNNPQQFISYRSVNFCSNVVDVVDLMNPELDKESHVLVVHVERKQVHFFSFFYILIQSTRPIISTINHIFNCQDE